MDRRIDNLHLLRAIFAMGIVLDHINLDDLVGYGKKIFYMGTTGVAFFFVLSGFLMIYTYKPMKCSEYLKKKFLRIFPTMWVFTLGVVLLDCVFRRYIGWNFVNWADINSKMVIKSLLCVPILEHSNEIIIPPAWTLSFEIWFYMIGIVLVLVGEKFYFIVLSVWGALIMTGSLAGSSLFALNPLFLELIMGVAIAYIVKKNVIRNKRFPLIFGWGGVILFITALCSVTEIVHVVYISSLPHWIKYGVPAALIVLGAAGCKSLLKPEGMLYKVLSVVADHSYSIYLTHYITIRLMQLVFRMFAHNNIVLGQGIRFFTIFIVCIICGVIAGKMIEKNCSRLFARLLFTRNGGKAKKYRTSEEK